MYPLICKYLTINLSQANKANVVMRLTMNMTTEVNIKIGVEVENLKIYSFIYIHATSKPSHLIDHDEVELESMIPIGEGS